MTLKIIQFLKAILFEILALAHGAFVFLGSCPPGFNSHCIPGLFNGFFGGGLDSSEFSPSTCETQEVHVYVPFCLDMTEIILKAG